VCKKMCKFRIFSLGDSATSRPGMLTVCYQVPL
jgi:hypothetical protein